MNATFHSKNILKLPIAFLMAAILMGLFSGGLSLTSAKAGSANQTGSGTPQASASVTISGKAGVGGARLDYNDGGALSVTADVSGNYLITVSTNWSGTVTPSKTGYVFTPVNKQYLNLAVDKTGENYTAALADVTRPSAIGTLTAAQGNTWGSVELRWTAVGDDGFSGKATSYLVRYSSTSINSEAAWEASTPVITGIPLPGNAGTSQGMKVTGLVRGQRYYFSVRAQDEVPNLGGLSKSPSTIATIVLCRHQILVSGYLTKRLCGEGTASGFYGSQFYANITPRRAGFLSKTIGITIIKGGGRLCFSPYRGGAIYLSTNNGKNWVVVWSQVSNRPPCVYISSSGLYAWGKAK